MDGNPAFETPTRSESSASQSARLTVLLLGPPRVLVHGETVIGPRSQKVLALLAYLAAEAHRPHLRSALAALFWPDAPEKQAFQSLRQTLSRLRHAIRDGEAHPPHLIADPETIAFNLQSDLWLDVAVFRTLLAKTQHHRHRRLDVCPTCLSQLAEASAYYRGDFLADLSVPESIAFDEWLLIEREHLRQQACTVLQALTSSHLARGESQPARDYARRLLLLDPWNEEAHRLMLCALVLSDGRNAALRHYQAFRHALADELGVEPEDETMALVEQIRNAALADMHPCTPATAVNPTALLPMSATPFIGREAERKQVNDYLAGQDQRLITVYGPGGSGKTRLALEIAAEQAPLWHDGVWFVPLAGVPTAEGLLHALANALHMETAGTPLTAIQLIDFLWPKELLLILDSFEHLVDGAPLLRDIVHWTPQVRILITSRACLGLRDEWAIQLGGLEVPPPPSPFEGEEANAESYSALRLFLQSAHQANPHFTLSPENLPHVVRICRLVAGLPLGIELAATWVRLFPCRHIADEVEKNLDFLHSTAASPSDAPERQHSLRATFEYSYNLLPELEQAIFRKLSVFRGGFTAEAAQQVAGAQPAKLSCLLDKSLI